MYWKIILNGKVIKIYKNRNNAIKAYRKKEQEINHNNDILEIWDNYNHCKNSTYNPR